MSSNLFRKLNIVLFILLAGFSLAACGGGGGGGGEAVSGQGSLSTSLTDSSTDEYQAIYVTIARVEVHHESGNGWETVAEPGKTYNLLELVNGVRQTLGISSLDAGHYTQMRLIIGVAPDNSLNIFDEQHPYANYIINLADEIHKLKVPSGTNTGLKIVNGFDINEDQTTELLLDFDAMSSVVKAGNSGKYLLKPTIKVLDTADYVAVSGTVTEADAVPTILLDGALVTAQISDPTNLEAKDQVVIEAGTLADDNGEYSLFLEPGDYNIVAGKTGYLTDCTAISLQIQSAITVDFPLTATTDLGIVSGTVSIANGSEYQYVTIDFRQELTCVDALEATMITVKSVNIANGGSYSVILPAGDYEVVASTFGEVTQVDNVAVVPGEEYSPTF